MSLFSIYLGTGSTLILQVVTLVAYDHTEVEMIQLLLHSAHLIKHNIKVNSYGRFKDFLIDT